MRCVDMRTLSIETWGARPDTRANAESMAAAANGIQCGSFTVGDGSPVSVESASRISFSVMLRCAEDVALAGFSLLGREEVARCDVAHVDEVQPRVHVGGHLAIQEVHDHLARSAWA